MSFCGECGMLKTPVGACLFCRLPAAPPKPLKPSEEESEEQSQEGGKS